MIESFSAFHEKLKVKAAFIAFISVLLPLVLLAKRLLVSQCANNDPSCCDQIYRVRRKEPVLYLAADKLTPLFRE